MFLVLRLPELASTGGAGAVLAVIHCAQDSAAGGGLQLGGAQLLAGTASEDVSGNVLPSAGASLLAHRNLIVFYIHEILHVPVRRRRCPAARNWIGALLCGLAAMGRGGAEKGRSRDWVHACRLALFGSAAPWSPQSWRRTAFGTPLQLRCVLLRRAPAQSGISRFLL